MEIIFRPNATARVLLIAVAGLTLMHTLALIAYFQIDDPMVFRFTQWFDLDIEYNLPSWYSALAIFASALLFLVIAVSRESRLDYVKLCWFGLGLIFLFLSADEAFQLHEALGDKVETQVVATGLFYFPWVIPYLSLLVLLAAFYVRFLFLLPRKTAKRLVLAAALFLTGAVVFDMLGGREAELNGYDSITYCVLYTIEEVLEMLGILVLIHTLLAYIEDHHGLLSIRIYFRSTDGIGPCER